MSSILTKILGADSGFAALLEKVNALFDHRHSRDWFTKDADFNVVATEHLYLVDCASAAVTGTLPATPEPGEAHAFKVIDVAGGSFILDGDGNDIDGDPDKTFSAQYDFVVVQFDDDSGQWLILSN